MAVKDSSTRYPNYKDSEVDWIGQVPTHWDVAKTKYIARLETGHTPSREKDEYWDGEIPWYSLADVWQVRQLGRRYIKNTKEQVTEAGISNSSARILPKGTVVISRTASIGFPCILGVPAATDQSMVAWICSPDLLSEYLHRTFQAMDQEFNRLAIGSTHDTIYMPDVNQFRTPLPPISEQKSIVSYLNFHIRNIDQLINKKQSLIELLRERRQSIVSRLVTKGGDPPAVTKESGIDWLGEIPAHWDNLPLRRIVEKFVDYRGSTPPKTDEGIPLITAANVRDGELSFDKERAFVSEEIYEDWMNRGDPQEGDVLLTTEAPLGEVAQVEDEKIALAQRIIMLKPNTDYITGDYLKTYFQSKPGKQGLYVRATGSTAVGIKSSHLRDVDVLVPPIEEQKTILKHIKNNTSYIKRLTEKLDISINILEEKRQAIITSAVTGDIDLRGWESPNEEQEIAA